MQRVENDNRQPTFTSKFTLVSALAWFKRNSFHSLLAWPEALRVVTRRVTTLHFGSQEVYLHITRSGQHHIISLTGDLWAHVLMSLRTPCDAYNDNRIYSDEACVAWPYAASLLYSTSLMLQPCKMYMLEACTHVCGQQQVG